MNTSRELRILVTGAGGPAGIQALKLLKNIPGVFAYGADVDALSAGRFFAQDFATMERVSDPAAYRRSLWSLIERWQITHVLPTVAEELVIVHEALAGAPVTLLASPHETLALCHDKRRLYTWMGERFPSLAARWQRADQYPLWDAETYFLKPAIGRGARGCRTISRRELDVLRENGFITPDTLLMEMLTGKEWTVDAYVTASGDVPMLLIRERVALTGGISLKGRTVHDPMIDQATRALLKQMPTFGPTCIQWKADAQGNIKLLEVNPRLSGGVMISAAAGADPVRCLIEEVQTGTVQPVSWRDVTVIRSFEERVLEDARPAQATTLKPTNQPMKILAIGAHPDDIEIGCGGTLAAHVEQGDQVLMVVMTAGEMGGASPTVRLMEFSEAAKVIGAGTVCLGYKDTEVPSGHEPVQKLDEIIAAFKPDRAYIPFVREIHQDHARTSQAALAACRNVPQVLMYEGPSTFTDFVVNYFVDISSTLEKKIQAIRCHASQGEKEILKIESIRSLNRFRGYQARAQYAEGFSTFRFIEKI